MTIPPVEGRDEQDGTDFLSTQVVFGTGSRPAVGLDVLATKVAVDFQGLSSEGGDSCVKRNLDALREATGVDAMCIALFDTDMKIIERVAIATALFAPFDPQVMKGAILWEGRGIEEVGRDERSGRVIVRVDPRYFRPADVDTLLGDASKARQKLGW